MANFNAHPPGEAFPRKPLAQAACVAAVFDDSVVGVKHIFSPRGGQPSLVTRGLVLVGSLLLLSSAFAFASGLSTAIDNEGKLREHLAAKRVAHEFRPRLLHDAFDWMALGGGLGGVLLLAAGLVRSREERVQPTYTLGSSAHADFPLSLGEEDVALLAPQGDGFVLTFSDSWEGEFVQNGERTPLSALAALGLASPSIETAGALEMELEEDTRVVLSTGNHEFQVRATTRARRQSLSLLAAIDSRFLAFLSGTAMAVLGLMYLLDTHYEQEKGLYIEEFALATRLEDLRIKPSEAPILRDSQGRPASGASADPGARMAGEEGRMIGDESQGRAVENHAPMPQLSREQARGLAREAGVLGFLAPGSFDALTGSADFSSGLDDEDLYGLAGVGDGMSEAVGWGYGVSGVGPGGGGSGWGTVRGGTGWGTTCDGCSLGGQGSGTGSGMLLKRASKAPVVVMCGHPGCPSMTGDLDKNIIRRYIRRKLSRIRHCYEKELLAQPDLQGTMEVHFQIAPNGLVVDVQASGLGNRPAERCVAAVIRSIKFPKPNNDGYVAVTYPFTFSPAN